MGARDLRRGGTTSPLAAEPACHAGQPPDAADSAAAHGSPEAVPGQSGEAAERDDAGVQGAQHDALQSDGRVPADVAPDADPVRALLRFPEYNRVPRRLVSLAARHLA